jgi:hypothetical protein
MHGTSTQRADEIRMPIFKTFGVKKITELVVTSNKLTNNFPRFVINGLCRMWLADRQLDHAELKYDGETKSHITQIKMGFNLQILF